MQGVGFRPFVYQLAKQLHLTGYVINSSNGVHIYCNADEPITDHFYNLVVETAPALAKITTRSINKIPFQHYVGFTINESETGGVVNLLLTPDYGICAACSTEMHDRNNRRYQYPFITCAQCGPRYSIINQLPYDRSKTTMHPFNMCVACNEEYHNPNNRRHYAQTNSCESCGVKLAMFSQTGEQLFGNNSTIINKAVQALRQQQIVAVKGIGGYLLLCDATNETVVKELRKRKHRPQKPFALLYPNIQAVLNDFELSTHEADALVSQAAPIVLLQKKAEAVTKLADYAIAPGLSQLGVMLPYAPLLQLIAGTFKQPLIATSANVSDSPIIYNDKDAKEKLSAIADCIITHNREIAAPQDDSVLRFSTVSKQPIISRRARGLAPSYFSYRPKTNKTMLATGALLKSSFTFVTSGNTFISQYLGNTNSYDAQQTYKALVQHYISCFHQGPELVIADKHPLYFSTEFAAFISKHFSCALVQVQHHKAHAAAVLAENQLLQSEMPVACVVWDGTGIGDDGNIWGGEFFVYQNNSLDRCFHFDYFPTILADKMAKEPRLSAMAICSKIGLSENILKEKFSETEWKLYQKLLAVKNNLQCSSVGRIFDAVASLLNICDKQSYEGEAALLLEALAQQYFEINGYHFTTGYCIEDAHISTIPTAAIFSGIVTDIINGKAANYVAAKFHYSLVQLVKSVANTMQVKHIAFSGGVFQNAVLVHLLHYYVEPDFQLYFHTSLSPNDENISFGQMVCYDQDIDGIQTLNTIRQQPKYSTSNHVQTLTMNYNKA